ncbi:hypothetical protein OHT51_11365 [Streptomyces sp. NBC_00299]|nr:hypothetical protein [Streptomyces sp. NBC_00299]
MAARSLPSVQARETESTYSAIRGEEATRREFVGDLLEGRTDLGRLAERAERLAARRADS